MALLGSTITLALIALSIVTLVALALRVPDLFGQLDLQGFQWNGGINAGELGVTIGTALLAWFTYRLAIETRRSSQLAVAAQDKPFLVPCAASPGQKVFVDGKEFTPGAIAFTDYAGEHEQQYFFVSLWNQGRGPAVVHRMSLRFQGVNLIGDAGPNFAVAVGGISDQGSLVTDPNMLGEVRLRMDADGHPAFGGNCELAVEFTDIGNTQYVMTSRIWVPVATPATDGYISCEMEYFEIVAVD
jgi:hypothetical protein